jgi:hypothetical protein
MLPGPASASAPDRAEGGPNRRGRCWAAPLLVPSFPLLGQERRLARKKKSWGGWLLCPSFRRDPTRTSSAVSDLEPSILQTEAGVGWLLALSITG